MWKTRMVSCAQHDSKMFVFSLHFFSSLHLHFLVCCLCYDLFFVFFHTYVNNTALIFRNGLSHILMWWYIWLSTIKLFDLYAYFFRIDLFDSARFLTQSLWVCPVSVYLYTVPNIPFLMSNQNSDTCRFPPNIYEKYAETHTRSYFII